MAAAAVSRSAYGRHRCPLCLRWISAAGFARYQHMKMHEREGLVEMRRRRRWTSRGWIHRKEWYATGLGSLLLNDTPPGGRVLL